MFFIYLLGIFSGAALPMQTSVNQSFREKTTSPYLTTLVSVVGGFLIVSCILLVTGEGQALPMGLVGVEPWWIWTGGFWGFFLATFNVLALPVIGSVQTIIFSVLGQILTGLLIDNFGWFRASVIQLTPLRALGATLVFVGVMIVSVVGRRSAAGKEAAFGSEESDMDKAAGVSYGKNPWPYRGFAFMSGVFIGIQLAVNGYLGIVAGSSYKSTFISLLGAILTTVIACLVLKAGGKLYEGKPEPLRSITWWRWTGGLFGFICIWVNVILANALGMGLSVIISLIGQIAGGMLIDATGFLGIAKTGITLRKVLGLLIMVSGAVIINLL